jgi:hypothetical protein
MSVPVYASNSTYDELVLILQLKSPVFTARQQLLKFCHESPQSATMVAFDRHSNFSSQQKIKIKIAACSHYSILYVYKASAKWVKNSAQNRRRHGPYGHDVTNFDKIVKTKDKPTIYRNETLRYAKH